MSTSRHMVCAMAAVLAACDGTSTTPTSPTDGPALPSNSTPAFVSWKLSPTALQGTWVGTYPDGQPITYTFLFTGIQEVNWRTGNVAWAYSATYTLGGGEPVPFPADFEPPIAYWGAISFGTLTSNSKMLVAPTYVAGFGIRRKHP